MLIVKISVDIVVVKVGEVEHLTCRGKGGSGVSLFFLHTNFNHLGENFSHICFITDHCICQQIMAL